MFPPCYQNYETLCGSTAIEAERVREKGVGGEGGGAVEGGGAGWDTATVTLHV